MLDILLEREPFLAASAASLSRAEAGRVEGYIAATTFITLEYLAAKHLGRSLALAKLEGLLSFLRVARVDDGVIRTAVSADPRDFEDAVIAAAALASGIETVVTRDARGFEGFAVSIVTPAALLQSLEATDLRQGDAPH